VRQNHILSYDDSEGKEPPVSSGKEAWWVPEPVWTRWRRGKIP